MRKTTSIFTIILFLACIKSNGQLSFVPDTIAKKLGVKTAVKQTFFGDSKTPSMTYTEYYDINGKMTERISFDNHFNFLSIREFFFYNNKGQLIKEQSIHYTAKDSTIGNHSYAYNSKGQVDRNFKGKIDYKYDSKGRVMEKNEKTVKPTDLKTIYHYDSLGQLIFEEQYFYSTLQSKKNWDYNNKGQIIKETASYNYSSKDIPTTQYETTSVYNDIGLLIMEYQKQTIVSISDNKSDNRTYNYQYTFY